jgi:hypothetical protein
MPATMATEDGPMPATMRQGVPDAWAVGARTRHRRAMGPAPATAAHPGPACTARPAAGIIVEMFPDAGADERAAMTC